MDRSSCAVYECDWRDASNRAPSLGNSNSLFALLLQVRPRQPLRYIICCFSNQINMQGSLLQAASGHRNAAFLLQVLAGKLRQALSRVYFAFATGCVLPLIKLYVLQTDGVNGMCLNIVLQAIAWRP